MLTAVEAETEADPAGILLGWLAVCGSYVGRGAYCVVGARQHHPALFVASVGKTSDAKGDTWSVSKWPIEQSDPEWASGCISNGVGSGEGLVELVADSGLDEPLKDKRRLVRLSELSAVFKRSRREGAALSEVIREAWDGDPLSVPNRKDNALQATGYSISILGDITPGVIRKMLDTGTEAIDGTANRFLWCRVSSPRDLPSGGNIRVLEPYLDRLRAALAFGKAAGRLVRDHEAEALWAEVHGGLKRCGDSIPHTERAAPQVLRLSLIYALLDNSKVIAAQHLRAALAVWDYCAASARYFFSDTGGVKQSAVEPAPNPLFVDILAAIPDQGINRSDLVERFKQKPVVETLAKLETSGLAFRRDVETGGRRAERWFRKDDTIPDTDEPDDSGEVEEAPMPAAATPKPVVVPVVITPVDATPGRL